MTSKAVLPTPVQVGLYCWECKQVRRNDGRRADDPRSPIFAPACGVDYGPGRHSHLRVSPVYVTHEPAPTETAAMTGKAELARRLRLMSARLDRQRSGAAWTAEQIRERVPACGHPPLSADLLNDADQGDTA